MKILVDGSSYGLHNVGDAAMLKVATERILKIFPNASVKVYTKNPKLLYELNPQVTPLSLEGKDVWFNQSYFTQTLGNKIPLKLSNQLSKIERNLKKCSPEKFLKLVKFKAKINGEDLRELDEFITTYNESCLVISSGGGFLNDAIQRHAFGVLNTIKLAINKKINTAMFGQGVGPVADKRLTESLQMILPKVNLITLRERDNGPQILKKLGVDQSKYFVTGDDAIELAYRQRTKSHGRHLGLNVRMADYAEMNPEIINKLFRLIERIMVRFDTSLIPIPIMLPEDLSDVVKYFGRLLTETDCIRNPNVVEVIRQAGRCRLIITGSYHAAVFGLSQGIPVIGLSKSDYYLNKFQGLRGMFGNGCDFVNLNQNGAVEELEGKISNFWEKADLLQSGLLAASECQTELGNQAYNKLQQL